MGHIPFKERPKVEWEAQLADTERESTGAAARECRPGAPSAPGRAGAAPAQGSPPPAPARGAVARIYRPARSAMQAGNANSRHWVLEFEPGARAEIEPLMGWTASRDVAQQVQLRFATREQAVAFADRQGWAYAVAEPRAPRRRPKSYADNFKWRPGGTEKAGS